jgi:hypothetical protein
MGITQNESIATFFEALICLAHLLGFSNALEPMWKRAYQKDRDLLLELAHSAETLSSRVTAGTGEGQPASVCPSVYNQSHLTALLRS